MATKSARQKYIVYDLPIFEARIILIYFKSYKYANKILVRENVHDYEVGKTDAGMVCKAEIDKPDGTKGTRYIVIIGHDNNEEDLKNTVVHETWHLTQEVLESKGIPFKKGGHNEVYAYLHSHLQIVVENFITP